MTKEELKQEAEEYSNNLLFVYETDVVQRIVRERVKLALIDVLEPREKRIAELEKENAELKEQLRLAKEMPYSAVKKFAEEKTQEQLTKAKELLKRYVKIYVNPYPEEEIELRNEAEQFLNEVIK